nr:MAG TPA: hypothetical protein [Caudoviricetes sp.]
MTIGSRGRRSRQPIDTAGGRGVTAAASCAVAAVAVGLALTVVDVVDV